VAESKKVFAFSSKAYKQPYLRLRDENIAKINIDVMKSLKLQTLYTNEIHVAKTTMGVGHMSDRTQKYRHYCMRDEKMVRNASFSSTGQQMINYSWA